MIQDMLELVTMPFFPKKTLEPINFELLYS
jgi:hypothetical protein